MAATTSGTSPDQDVIESVVNYVKSAGLFDQFRRDCLNDVDTKPAYQNLRQRVEGYVSTFLSQHTWSPNLNKNQLRDSLRRQINQSEMLSMGVERIVEQVVEPKIQHILRPQIEKALQEYTEKKEREAPPVPTTSDDGKAALPPLPPHTTGTPPSTKTKVKGVSEKLPPDVVSRVKTTTSGEQAKKQSTDSGGPSEIKSKLKDGSAAKPSKDVKKGTGKVQEKSKTGTAKGVLPKTGEAKKSEQGSVKGKVGESDKGGSGKGESHLKTKTSESGGKQAEKLEKPRVGDVSHKAKGEPGTRPADKQKASVSDKPGSRKPDQKGAPVKDDKMKDKAEGKGSVKEDRLKSDKTESSKTEHVKSTEKSEKAKSVKPKDGSEKSLVVTKKKTDKVLKTLKDDKAKSSKSEVSSEKKGGAEVKPKSSTEGKTAKDGGKKEKPKDVSKDKKALPSKDKEGAGKPKDPAKGKSDVKKKSEIKPKASETKQSETKQKTSDKRDETAKGTSEKNEDGVKGKSSAASVKKETKKDIKKETSDVKPDKSKDSKSQQSFRESVSQKAEETHKPEKVASGLEQKDTSSEMQTAPPAELKVTTPGVEKPELLKTEDEKRQDGKKVASQCEKGEEVPTVGKKRELEHHDGDFSDDDNMSDVTVSSVHTSDLSSFEDAISSVSSVSSTSSDEMSSDEKDDTDRSLNRSRDSPFGSISGDSEKSGLTKRRPSTKALALNRYYSDSEDEEAREERRKKAAKEKEERAARRQQIKEDMSEKLKQCEEEKKKKREDKKKVKQEAKEREEAEKSGRRGRTKEQKKEEKVQAKREQKVLEKRMALRRQRTLNKKYLSEDFTSLFSQKEPTFITGDAESSDKQTSDSSEKQTSDSPAATAPEDFEVPAVRKRSSSKESEESVTAKAFFVSHVPDVGPSYEQTFIAKAMELGNYSCGLRRSGRRSCNSTDAPSGEPGEQGLQLPPTKRGRRTSSASGSSSDHSSSKGQLLDSQGGGKDKAASEKKEESHGREAKESAADAEPAELASPPTPTQDEPSFLEGAKEEAVVATAGDSPIPIYSLPSHTDQQQSPLKSIPLAASDTSSKDSFAGKSTEVEPHDTRGRASRLEDQGKWDEPSKSDDRPARHHRERRGQSSHHEGQFYERDGSKSPGASRDIRPRRQSSREHYKPMSDQFDYYSGKKPQHTKEEEPRRRYSSHSRESRSRNSPPPRESRLRNSPPPRESRSRKRHASPPKDHRASKYRGYSYRR